MQQKIIKDSVEEHFANVLFQNKFSNCLIVTSKGNEQRGYLDYFIEEMAKTSCKVSIYTTNEYPNFLSISDIFNKHSSEHTDLVLSIGGGSVVDIAKIFSACKVSNKQMKKFSDLKLSGRKKIYNIAVPTTAGSGAESTKFSTVWSKEAREKHSFEDSSLLPNLVYFIPKFTSSLPLSTTLTTSLDALCHSIDSLWNKNGNQESIDLSINAIKIISSNLPLLITDLNNLDYREKLLEASNLAGKAINISRTSLNHSISYPLTNYYNLPHGFACTFSVLSTINIFQKNLDKLHYMKSIFRGKELIEYINLKKIYIEYLGELDINLVSKKVLENSRSSNFLFKLDSQNIKEILINSQNYYLQK